MDFFYDYPLTPWDIHNTDIFSDSRSTYLGDKIGMFYESLSSKL